MSSIQQAAIEGFNTFLKEQKEEEGEAYISIHLFDNEFSTLQERTEIENAEELTEATFVPRGMTALHDAVCKTINEVNGAHAALTEEERPEKVLFIILTDGYENSSREYTLENLQTLIKRQTDRGWAFVYLAANQDAVETARSMNISTSNAVNFSASNVSSKAAYDTLSVKAKMFRSASLADSTIMAQAMYSADEQDIRDDSEKN